MILFDLLSTLEQEACLAGLDHTQIVMAVAAGDGLKPMDCSALTVVYLEFSTRILNPVISPFSATSRELQKMVG